MIVQPETLLRWHRDVFRFVWRHKSKTESKPGGPPLSEEETARTNIYVISKDSTTVYVLEP
jgi:hypothetical protein